MAVWGKDVASSASEESSQFSTFGYLIVEGTASHPPFGFSERLQSHHMSIQHIHTHTHNNNQKKKEKEGRGDMG